MYTILHCMHYTIVYTTLFNNYRGRYRRDPARGLCADELSRRCFVIAADM